MYLNYFIICILLMYFIKIAGFQIIDFIMVNVPTPSPPLPSPPRPHYSATGMYVYERGFRECVCNKERKGQRVYIFVCVCAFSIMRM